jgi:hypothetical protein
MRCQVVDDFESTIGAENYYGTNVLGKLDIERMMFE